MVSMMVDRAKQKVAIHVANLTLAYGDTVVQHDLNFTVHKGDIFFIMGGSGCGKSTLLKHMIGLYRPICGEVTYWGQPFFTASDKKQLAMRRHWGITYQTGGLFSAMTLAENIAVPLQQYTTLSDKAIRELAEYKLSLVGMGGYGDYYPVEISGGQCKRAGLARAIALDPNILFFDEPSAGLDPMSAQLLDELIVELRDSLDATVIIVSHELASILSIGDQAIYLDAQRQTILEHGDPQWLREHSIHDRVRRFLNRGQVDKA